MAEVSSGEKPAEETSQDAEQAPEQQQDDAPVEEQEQPEPEQEEDEPSEQEQDQEEEPADQQEESPAEDESEQEEDEPSEQGQEEEQSEDPELSEDQEQPAQQPEQDPEPEEHEEPDEQESHEEPPQDQEQREEALAETAPEDPEPVELQELTHIITIIDSLAGLCDRTLERLDLADRESAQELLQQYAAGLAYIPKALQLLHDYRRHKPDFDKRARELHKGLRSARKDDNALSSEEERVIAAAASLSETLLSSIGSLEHALAHIRANTQDLLSVIAYDEDDFEEFAQPLIERVNIGLVKDVAHEEHRRVLALKRDVIELRAFEAHLEELSSEEPEDA